MIPKNPSHERAPIDTNLKAQSFETNIKFDPPSAKADYESLYKTTCDNQQPKFMNWLAKKRAGNNRKR